MKLKTRYPTEFGQSVDFNGCILKFDRLGFVDIKNETGKELLINYPDHLISEEELSNVSKTSKDESVEVKELNAEIEKLKSKLEDRESIIKSIESENGEWKKLVEDFKVKSENAETELKDYTTQKQKEVDELKLHIKLAYKTNKELIDFCIAMKIDEEKYKNLTKKDELINLILNESRK